MKLCHNRSAVVGEDTGHLLEKFAIQSKVIIWKCKYCSHTEKTKIITPKKKKNEKSHNNYSGHPIIL